MSLFWAAINAGDRVDSALKDMAVIMKQLNRSDEAIEAIKSFRHLCPFESQESLDNILLELYKVSTNHLHLILASFSLLASALMFLFGYNQARFTNGRSKLMAFNFYVLVNFMPYATRFHSFDSFS